VTANSGGHNCRSLPELQLPPAAKPSSETSVSNACPRACEATGKEGRLVCPPSQPYSRRQNQNVSGLREVEADALSTTF
jgi:hypothetical protein